MNKSNKVKTTSVRRKFTVKKSSPAVPSGTYKARCIQFDEEYSKKFGKKQLKCLFEILKPTEFDGKELACWCNLENDDGEEIRMTEKSGLFKLFHQLNGSRLNVDDEVDCQDYVGRLYQLSVLPNDSGFSKIQSIRLVTDDDDQEETAPLNKSRKSASRTQSNRKTTDRQSRKEYDPDDVPFDEPEPDDDECQT